MYLSLCVRPCVRPGGRNCPAEQVPAGQKLAIMGVIVLIFSMAEVFFGMAMSSVTLVADGFHNLADAGGFGIAVFANWAQAHARDAGHLTHRTKEQKVERIGLIGGFTNCSITLILTFAAGEYIYIF
jgi:Co/Zn/Cd efflux system component